MHWRITDCAVEGGFRITKDYILTSFGKPTFLATPVISECNVMRISKICSLDMFIFCHLPRTQTKIDKGSVYKSIIEHLITNLLLIHPKGRQNEDGVNKCIFLWDLELT